MMIKATISQGRTVRLEQSRVVGGLQVKISCQLGKVVHEGERGAGNFRDIVSMLFGVQENGSQKKDQGWRGVRRAKSMGNLL
jgi:hypothetical protein